MSGPRDPRAGEPAAVPPGPPLAGRVALVTGASRGAGRGIALALGAAGATVVVSGRSTRGAPTTENLPGTIQDTAEEVGARGGRGLAVRCDHTREDESAALFERVEREYGGLDLLVNNAWGGYEGYDPRAFTAPFWEQPSRFWEGMFTAGVRAHWLASRLAVPRMMRDRERRGPGLIVSTVAWAHDRYLGSLVYDAAKAAILRMVAGMAQELRPHGIAALALAPGFMRTERVLAAHALHPFDLSVTESTAYVGRAVVALAADRDVMARSGRVLTVGELAREYGFTDEDGRQPEAFRMPEHPADR